MPTIRKRVAHVRLSATPLELEHLEPGEHLLAGECAICARGIAVARPLWEANRAAILANWRYPFPTFAELVLDGVPMPAGERIPEHDRVLWGVICDAAAAFRPGVSTMLAALPAAVPECEPLAAILAELRGISGSILRLAGRR